jgi:hypothetical protein
MNEPSLFPAVELLDETSLWDCLPNIIPFDKVTLPNK